MLVPAVVPRAAAAIEAHNRSGAEKSAIEWHERIDLGYSRKTPRTRRRTSARDTGLGGRWVAHPCHWLNPAKVAAFRRAIFINGSASFVRVFAVRRTRS